MNPVLIVVLAAYLLLALGCWIVYQLVRQNGRILMRLETLEERLAANVALSQPAGLPVVRWPLRSDCPRWTARS